MHWLKNLLNFLFLLQFLYKYGNFMRILLMVIDNLALNLTLFYVKDTKFY